MRRTIGVLAVVLALGLLASACSDNGDGGSSGDGDGGSATQLTIKDFAFQPSTLSGAPGATMTIDVTNEDSAEHSFTLDDESVSQDFEGGESGSVEVTLPESGTVGWHCKYHPQMTGTITVG